jgi:hypothetical protein
VSSDNTKSNYNFHKESGLDAAREHLREMEAAKTRRTVAAGSGTEAGVATRTKRKSSTQATSGIEGSDRAPLVPKSLHWTTEKRGQGEQSSRIEAEPRDRNDTTTSTQELRDSAVPIEDNSSRKSSVGRKVGGQAFKAAPSFTEKRHKSSMYPS